MKNHVWRPLYIAICIVAAGWLARYFIVPSDFGIHDRGYMYGWHRKSNEAEWRAVSVNYKTAKACTPCHQTEFLAIRNSPHSSISCENCHGPIFDHPKNPANLEINRSRELCLRCHARLPYKGTLRGSMKGIISGTHYPQAECMMCHYPHDPRRSNPKREVKK